jgi:hypothetical protein
MYYLMPGWFRRLGYPTSKPYLYWKWRPTKQNLFRSVSQA